MSDTAVEETNIQLFRSRNETEMTQNT